MRALIAAGALALACLALPSCIEFDEQEIRVRIDPEKDRLDALLVYRGLHRTGDFVRKAPELLDELQRGDRMVSILDPLIFFNVDAKDESGASKTSVWTKSLSVRNGRFFHDAEGRICGWQCLRVTNLKAILDETNETFRRWLATDDGRKYLAQKYPVSDEASLQLMKSAIAGGHAYFALRGKALAFRFPASSEGQSKLLARVVDELRRDPEDSKARRKLDRDVAMYASAEMSWIRSKDMVEVVVGVPDRMEQRIHRPRSGDDKTLSAESLAKLLDEKHVRVHDDVSNAAIEKEFEEFCAR